MFSLFRVIFLVFFIFYAISPISFVKTDDNTPVSTPADGSSISFRIFVLEYIFNAHDGPDSGESSTTRILLRKAKRICSSDPKRELFSAGYSVDTLIPVPLAEASSVVRSGWNSFIIKPGDIFSTYSSSLSPPSL